MTFDPALLFAIVAGGVVGYATGRYLLIIRRIAIPPFPVIAVVAVLGLISLRVLTAIGQDDLWHGVAFPIIIARGIIATEQPRKSLPPASRRIW